MFATNNNKKYEIQVICVLVVNIDLSISDLSLPARKIINKNSQSIMKDRQKKRRKRFCVLWKKRNGENLK